MCTVNLVIHAVHPRYASFARMGLQYGIVAAPMATVTLQACEGESSFVQANRRRIKELIACHSHIWRCQSPVNDLYVTLIVN